MDRVPFHVPEVDEDDVAAVVDVLRSRWLTTGDRCREFELRFAEAVGAREAVATNSGTAAMHLALEAAGVGPGDRVLVPALTFTATAEVVRYLGADPVFVDVDPVRVHVTPETVDRALERLDPAARESIRVLMPVHYGGLACDMAELTALAGREGWRVVDDAAHALPTRTGGRMIGAWADVTAFSFYATKTLSTGEGGMAVTDDPALAARMRVMRLHGIDRDAFDRYRSEAPAWAYEIVAPGFKYNLTDIAAALGLGQLARLQERTLARAEVAAAYDRRLAGRSGLRLPPRPGPEESHAWHLYPVHVDGGRDRRDDVIERMARAGVSTSVHFIPLHRMPYWRERYALREADFPGAEDWFAGAISLPIYPSLAADGIERVAAALEEALEATA